MFKYIKKLLKGKLQILYILRKTKFYITGDALISNPPFPPPFLLGILSQTLAFFGVKWIEKAVSTNALSPISATTVTAPLFLAFLHCYGILNPISLLCYIF